MPEIRSRSEARLFAYLSLAALLLGWCGFQLIAGTENPSEIFSDDFESGDTSAWTETIPAVDLSFVSPVDGSFVGLSQPVLHIAYDTPTGVAVDPETLTIDADGEPLEVDCDLGEAQTACLPVLPFADGPKTLAAVICFSPTMDRCSRVSPGRERSPVASNGPTTGACV